MLEQEVIEFRLAPSSLVWASWRQIHKEKGALQERQVR